MAIPILQYPTSINSDNNDYFEVQIFEYDPPNFLDSDDRGIFNIQRSQNTARTDKVKLLGQINLPMPDNISDNNAVTWDSDSLNSIAAGSIGAINDAVESITADSVLNNPLGAAKAVKNSISNSLTGPGGAGEGGVGLSLLEQLSESLSVLAAKLVALGAVVVAEQLLLGRF